MKDGLMNEFDLSEEELNAALNDAGESFKSRLEDTMGMKQEENPEPEVISKNDFTSNLLSKELKAPQSEAFTEESSVEIPLENKVVINNTGSGSSKDSGNKSLFGESAQSQNLFNQVMNNITEAAANVESFSHESYTDRAQMENIVRQITEKITISAGAGETSMELALHPASLGNVNILLTSSKDGIVAKFTAQNQIVKEAVEAQMVQLQQKFDEQGIKVTSIEVTIASHGFEQNLEQGNDRHSGEAEAEKKVKSLRRINLSELEADEEVEAQSDAEKIALQMMAANGNMVDFSA
jgi:flagellar hook-length control protein FliK